MDIISYLFLTPFLILLIGFLFFMPLLSVSYFLLLFSCLLISYFCDCYSQVLFGISVPCGVLTMILTTPIIFRFINEYLDKNLSKNMNYN